MEADPSSLTSEKGTKSRSWWGVKLVRFPYSLMAKLTSFEGHAAITSGAKNCRIGGTAHDDDQFSAAGEAGRARHETLINCRRSGDGS